MNDNPSYILLCIWILLSTRVTIFEELVVTGTRWGLMMLYHRKFSCLQYYIINNNNIVWNKSYQWNTWIQKLLASPTRVDFLTDLGTDYSRIVQKSIDIFQTYLTDHISVFRREFSWNIRRKIRSCISGYRVCHIGVEFGIIKL